VALVHGEPPAMAALAGHLQTDFSVRVVQAQYGQALPA
jgi:hypothetical protein